MILADRLRKGWPMTYFGDGEWVMAKPEPQPFIRRLQDAWAVLTGRAEAVEFAERKQP